MDSERTMTEEEKKQREQKKRDRERRHRETREKKPVSRKLDIIDQLDATSIYGTGSSLNNTIGGAGPLNTRPDHATFLGQQDDEAFKEWSKGARDRDGAGFAGKSKGEVPVFDPTSRGNILHGDESLGLGTSTFLEGTPAARTAIQKREEERAAEVMNDGLQRKKSLAHRIRNMNRGGRDFQPSGRMTNPEHNYGVRRSPSQSGPNSASSYTERNPFFAEYGSGKGEEEFTVRKADPYGNKVSPTSPRSGPLERRSTTDATGGEETQPKVSGGILGRMKSLKGRRQRPGPPADDDVAPGTAV
ncbi:hypothetical protein N0V88_003687 [Collariella sp. IMI 366227]|nr:hypothetical protein N0V88_003687 [Collariella sp. IMI 366227]